MTKAHLVRPVADFTTELAKAGGKPLYEQTPEQARQTLRAVQKSDARYPQIDFEEIKVALDNGREMRVLIARPKDTTDALPMVFYIHGGGWVMGDEVTHARLISRLAETIPAAVVFPIYMPSPEAQYPQTTNDLFSVLQYIAEFGGKFNLDSTRLIVAGDSVGGNMAAVMALMAKKNNFKPQIDFQLLLYPVTDAEFSNASYDLFADGPWLTKKAMQWFWQQYAPDAASRKEIYASPLRAAIEDLQGLPPALVITDENDVLRDEGEDFARLLDKAGVETASVRINGTIHDFLMLNALADTAPSKVALALAADAARTVFAAKAKAEETAEEP